VHAHNHATARLVRRHGVLEIRSTHHLFLKQKLGAPDKGTVLLCQQPLKKKYPRRCSKDTATIGTSRSAAERGEQPQATVRKITRIVAADWHGTGSKECAYFTLEKSATILASFPS
jgi:hypothetical protein